ncbi:MAG: hypothetical protein HY298_27175 [Verrucomicrobia bacterium]|nr:hypothetical protein [Verrucomicrobiota bacterium]
MNRRAFLKTIAVSALCAGERGLIASASKSAAENASSVRLDSDGMLVVNGRREFILGLYSLPNAPNPLEETRNAGFNLVNLPANAADFAKAREHGLYGWTSLGSISPHNRAEAEARIRKTVLALKDEPALLFWETEDEPTFVWKKTEARVPPADIIESYRFVKQLDPAHPLYLNHSPTNLVSTLRRYNDGADIVATDIYPVIPPGIRELYALWPDGQQGDFLNPHISQVGQYAAKMREVAGAKRVVFTVLQAFAWENLREKDRDPKMTLYPTRQQLRFMAWQSVVHGVNGLLYWGLSYAPPEAPLWNDLKTVARELSELKEALAARKAKLNLSPEYHDTGHSLDRGIEWTAKPTKNGVVLIAVNADKNPVEVTVSGLKHFRRCEVLFESRAVEWTPGKLHDSFAPFDTHIYALS